MNCSKWGCIAEEFNSHCPFITNWSSSRAMLFNRTLVSSFKVLIILDGTMPKSYVVSSMKIVWTYNYNINIFTKILKLITPNKWKLF